MGDRFDGGCAGKVAREGCCVAQGDLLWRRVVAVGYPQAIRCAHDGDDDGEYDDQAGHGHGHDEDDVWEKKYAC